jgi:hypothetical protein
VRRKALLRLLRAANRLATYFHKEDLRRFALRRNESSPWLSVWSALPGPHDVPLVLAALLPFARQFGCCGPWLFLSFPGKSHPFSLRWTRAVGEEKYESLLVGDPSVLSSTKAF